MIRTFKLSLRWTPPVFWIFSVTALRRYYAYCAVLKLHHNHRTKRARQRARKMLSKSDGLHTRDSGVFACSDRHQRKASVEPDEAGQIGEQRARRRYALRHSTRITVARRIPTITLYPSVVMVAPAQHSLPRA